MAVVELTDEEVEQLRKNVVAENATLYEKAKETGTFMKEGDPEKILEMQKDWARDVLEARNLESIPSWVDGPRPSNEVLAMREPENPLDEEPWETKVKGLSQGLAKLILDERVISVGISCYELPSSFKVEPVDADGVQCCWCNWPGTSTSKGVIMFIHGGGGFMGDIWPSFCARLSCASGLRVLTVDYRMAPEHPAKVGVEDMVTAYLWLTKTTPPEQVVIYGQSYGGWAAVATLQALLQKDKKPACAVSESPILPQFGYQGGLWEMLAGTRNLHGRRVPSASVSIEEIREDPFYNILGGQLKGLPPLYVSVGSLEHVENQIKAATALAEACKSAGGQVEYELVRNLRHTPGGAGLFVVPESTAYVARLVAFMDKHLAGDGAK